MTAPKESSIDYFCILLERALKPFIVFWPPTTFYGRTYSSPTFSNPILLSVPSDQTQ